MGKIIDMNGTFTFVVRDLRRRAARSPAEKERAQRLADVARGVRLACAEILSSPKRDPIEVARELVNEVRDHDKFPPLVSTDDDEWDWFNA